MKPVRIGCSGWMYDDWRGRLYPDKLAKRRWLEEYARHFDTVEMRWPAGWSRRLRSFFSP
jgi:uncharacterized protein YecE (DUF72 family)